MTRGYFEIGIVRGKTVENLGTLWRTAYQLGAAGIFTIGARCAHQASDTTKAFRHIPLRAYDSIEAFMAARPHDCPLVAVETGGRALSTFQHPERAIYLLGSEDGGIPKHLLSRAQSVISLPAVRSESYNVAVAGALVMYDRLTRSVRPMLTAVRNDLEAAA